jgi:hypothetical protein
VIHERIVQGNTVKETLLLWVALRITQSIPRERTKQLPEKRLKEQEMDKRNYFLT